MVHYQAGQNCGPQGLLRSSVECISELSAQGTEEKSFVNWFPLPGGQATPCAFFNVGSAPVLEWL